MIATTTARTTIRDHGTSVLTFRRVEGETSPPDGEYALRGGICWPICVEPATGRIEGFAVVAAHHLASHATWVLAQTPWVAIDHVQDRAGAIQYQGLCGWLVESWAQWYADTYAWRQPWHTCRRYLTQMLRSPLIQPKPHLIELEWSRDADARAIVAEIEATGKLKYPAQSPLHVALQEYAAAEPSERDRFPAVHALTCALFALTTATRPTPAKR